MVLNTTEDISCRGETLCCMRPMSGDGLLSSAPPRDSLTTSLLVSDALCTSLAPEQQDSGNSGRQSCANGELSNGEVDIGGSDRVGNVDEVELGGGDGNGDRAAPVSTTTDDVDGNDDNDDDDDDVVTVSYCRQRYPHRACRLAPPHHDTVISTASTDPAPVAIVGPSLQPLTAVTASVPEDGRASDSVKRSRYPQPPLQPTPFRLLHGEHVLCAGYVSEGHLYATNYRLHLQSLTPPGGAAESVFWSASGPYPSAASTVLAAADNGAGLSGATSSAAGAAGGEAVMCEGPACRPPGASDSGGFSVPRTMVEIVEMRDMFGLMILCKDGRSYKFSAVDSESAAFWLRQCSKPLALTSSTTANGSVSAASSSTMAVSSTAPAASSVAAGTADSFCFAFHAWSSEYGHDNVHALLTESNDGVPAAAGVDLLDHRRSAAASLHALKTELERLEFDVGGAWRISSINENFQLCASYPRHLVVPASISDSMLTEVARFRALHRVPAVCWRHRRTGAVLARSGQPEVGWLGWRSPEDEELVKAISEACATNSLHPSAPHNRHHLHSCRQQTDQPRGSQSSPSPRPDQLTVGGCGVGDGCCSDRSCRASSSSCCSVVPAVSADSGPVPLSSSSTTLPDPRVSDTAAPDTNSLRDLSDEASVFKNTKKAVIVDARSYTAAVANRARGGGVECHEYYTTSEVVFMNLPNIHTIRKSFHALRSLLATPSTDHSSWYQALENTRWMSYGLSLLRAAVAVQRYIDELGRSVLVHCSDGWDRTPQITALAQLLMDPYYRTFQGFRVLLEREWLDFGHKFADRCALPGGKDDANERCPVFLQWLDCVYQLTVQFPSAFQFNSLYLAKLALHTYSCLFGTFSCNSTRERLAAGVNVHSYSVFAYLLCNRDIFTNYLYSGSEQVLTPSLHPHHTSLWTAVYLGGAWVAPTSSVRPDLGESTATPFSADAAPPGGRTSIRSIRKECVGSSATDAVSSSAASVVSMGGAVATLTRARSDEQLCGRRQQLSRTASQPSLVDSTCGGDVDHMQCESEVAAVCARASDGGAPTCLRSAPPSPPLSGHMLNSLTNTSTSATTAPPIIGSQHTADVLYMYPLHAASSDDNTTSLVEPETERESGVCDERLAESCCDLQLINSPPDVAVSVSQDRSTSTTDLPATTTTISSASANGCVRRQPAARSSCRCQHGSVSAGNVVVATDSPPHSRTPSSGYPTTPSDDRLSERTSWSTGRRIDMDGMPRAVDLVQQRLYLLHLSHKNEVEMLQRELQLVRQSLCQQLCRHCTGHPNNTDTVSGDVGACGVGGGVGASSGTCGAEPGAGSVVSDVSSWETVDESDTRPQLWMPDHAAARCSGCDTAFWLGCRRHHCRSCGNIYCGECSRHLSTVPHEQLYKPVRVCSQCFARLTATTPAQTDHTQ